MTTADRLDRVLAACERNRARDLADLFTLLAQPSISTQNVGVRECAELERGLLESAGLDARIIETEGHPFVFGERSGPPGTPTLLLYGHYDVQPPDPLEAWVSPPFEPTIRDGRIFARGVGDNKGQHFAHVAAIRAWTETTGGLPVGVKVLLEGEEECGSPQIDGFVAAHRELLAADLVVTADGPALDAPNPSVEYGVRGMVYVELFARGAKHDLHSGNWGGIAPNPAWTLIHLLGTMLTPDGEVKVDGFLDDVQPLSPAAQAALKRIPLDQAAALAGIGVRELPPPAGVGYFERLMARPTCNVAGFHSGYGGPGSKTIIPAEATVKMDFRLVPDQDPDDVFAKIEGHVARHAPSVEVLRLGSMRPSHTPLEHPRAEPLRRALRTGFGAEPVDIPLVGGSLPDAVWTRTLGLPSFVTPYANHDEANHAPNENMAVERFYAGIRTTAALLAELTTR
jgi:acetylornithine deacetylase/succinyl-diaminopimelate desuccinylase-like protein